MSAFSNFSQAGREDGYVSVYLAPGSTNFPRVPVELKSFVSGEEWERRLTSISQLALRYSKPLFERVWIFLGFILMLVTPVVVYRVLANKFYHPIMSDDDFQKLGEVRLIAFGIFTALLFVIWAPFLLWKGVGRYRMQQLIREWSKIDLLAKNKGLYVPIWSVVLASGYSSSVTVRVTIPPRSNPTVFHPDAYLPPYIAPPQYLPGPGYANDKQIYGSTPFQDVKI